MLGQAPPASHGRRPPQPAPAAAAGMVIYAEMPALVLTGAGVLTVTYTHVDV